LVEIISYEAHLWRRTGKAMNQESTYTATLQEKRGWIEMWLTSH
jgi:hypothetical protein